MAINEIKRNSGFIKVLASQAAGRAVNPKDAEEAAQIVAELLADDTKDNNKLIAQTISYAVKELQSGDLDFLGNIADIKNINYGDKAMFNVKLGGIKAYIQAKGSTTARSYVASKQVAVETEEISARPAINIVDLRSGRVNIAELIRDANREITTMKLQKIEAVLHAALQGIGASPWYAHGASIVKATLDAQITYFRRLGPVTLLGDLAAVSQLAGITGMVMNEGATNPSIQRSPAMVDEFNGNGFIGMYNGCRVVAMQNGYRDDSTTPILNPNWIYIIPGGATGDARNLKIANEGGVNTMASQNIDDRTYEVLIDEWFGAGFVTGKKPTMGAYYIGA
jgi:hypothetical protein